MFGNTSWVSNSLRITWLNMTCSAFRYSIAWRELLLWFKCVYTLLYLTRQCKTSRWFMHSNVHIQLWAPAVQIRQIITYPFIRTWLPVPNRGESSNSCFWSKLLIRIINSWMNFLRKSFGKKLTQFLKRGKVK